MNETSAERVKRLRNEQGFTLAGLALAVGVSIRQIESGTVQSPSLILGVRLADALHVEVRFLALGEGSSTADRFAAIERRLDNIENRPLLDSRR